MKAIELRMGNIALNSSNEAVTVREISNTLVRTTPDDIHLISELKPIPLTEDILLKCGFEKAGYGRYHSLEFKGFRKGLYDVFLLENGSITFMDNVFEKLITSVKHVHQLQNLYFALCGEELEVNL